MLAPDLPSENAEATYSLASAIACSSIHSTPSLLLAISTSVATENWCMFVATANDGDRYPMAFCTRTISDADNPFPPWQAGMARSIPPYSLNMDRTGLFSDSRSSKLISVTAALNSGRYKSSTSFSQARCFIYTCPLADSVSFRLIFFATSGIAGFASGNSPCTIDVIFSPSASSAIGSSIASS